VRQITGQAALDEALATPGLVVVDWWAGWCGPCRSLKPQLETIAAKYPDVAFFGVQQETNADLMGKYHIGSFPCIRFYKQSQQVAEVIGCRPDQIEATVQTHRAAPSFGGAGHSLGGLTGSASEGRPVDPRAAREARLKRLGGGGGGGRSAPAPGPAPTSLLTPAQMAALTAAATTGE
jgi:thioredoxin 1